MKILIVKISSMGDLIHTLPAVTDAIKYNPDIQFDWVADEAFADVPSWHSSINKIIKTAHRRWKKNWLQAITSGEIKKVFKQLRYIKYDLIIDAQSNVKSALITRLARGKKMGLDNQSVAEPGISFFYNKTFSISRDQHAIDRMRQIFAKAIGYSFDQHNLDYGIDVNKLPQPNIALPEKFIFLTHTASRSYKLWPEGNWIALIKRINEKGFAAVLPWGNEQEKKRAEKFAQNTKNTLVLPDLSLTEKVSVIAKAHAAVSVDTGLGHLTAALNIPNINLYGPTDPKLVGAKGASQIHLTADLRCAPCKRSACHQEKNTPAFERCMPSFSLQRVLDALDKFI